MERSVELVLKNEEQAYLSPLFKEFTDHELTAPLGRAAVYRRGGEPGGVPRRAEGRTAGRLVS